eukprot:9799957-Ditylum_brightwellii.AAC.1
MDAWEEISNRFGTFGPHKCIVEKENLDRSLARQHIKHFGQAQGTPFTTTPLTEIFGEALETEATKKFVDNNLDPNSIDSIDETTLKVLQGLIPNNTNPPQIDTIITSKNMKQGFKIWCEKTSTSPRGNYLGLYKAWLTAKDNDEDILPKE